MPIISKSNNRILPPNTRSVDVARQTIRDLIPLQQRKYHNAFMVEGFEAIVYTRLRQGLPCSCQAHSKALATHLGEDGKLPMSKMNELLTGQDFGVGDYGTKQRSRKSIVEDPTDNDLFETDSVGKSTFEDVVGDLGNPNVTVVGLDVGVNGSNFDSDDSGDFENLLDSTTTRCGVCLGTGYVGGYSPLSAWRQILCTQTCVTSVDGTIEVNTVPHSFFTKQVVFTTVFPKGFIGLDAFSVWNNLEQITPKQILLDGLDYSKSLFIAFCDGRSHTVTIVFDELTTFTHVEIQVNLSERPSYIEFPKLEQNNLNFNDMTGDVALNASPLIPSLGPYDVLAESSYGKRFVITNATLWNNRNRSVLGWDVNARVIQPEEILNILPRRAKLVQRTSNMVRDNANHSNRRT